jgi:hypothetical protein
MSLRLLAAAAAVCLAPLAARAADDEHPYKNVKVGDFATYKMDTKVPALNLTIGGSMTQTVTAKDDKEATVKGSGKVSFNGKDMEIPGTEQKIDLTKPFDPTKIGGGPLGAGIEGKVEKLKDGKEKIKVAGKEYEATWTTYKMKAKAMGQDIEADLKVWMAKDIPMGMAKLEMTAKAAGQDMVMTLELTETGNKKQ